MIHPNEDRAAPEPDDDPLLDEALRQLRQIEPPLEARISSRVAIATQLAALQARAQTKHVPWWRRSICVPVPAAAGLVVALALATIARNEWQSSSPQTSQQQGVEQLASSRDGGSQDPQRTPRDNVNYYATETYVCGIGRVSSQSRYFIEELRHD